MAVVLRRRRRRWRCVGRWLNIGLPVRRLNERLVRGRWFGPRFRRHDKLGQLILTEIVVLTGDSNDAFWSR